MSSKLGPRSLAENAIDVELATIADLAAAAPQFLSENAHSYFAAAARDGYTLARNIDAWRAWEFLPRVLVDVSAMTVTTSLLGIPSSPFAIAPMAAQQLAHSDGELATARAAAAAGCTMVVSISSNTPLEILTAVPGLNVWFQLYLFPDRDRNTRIVRRAEAAGVHALVVTVDVSIGASTHDNPRRGVQFPSSITFPMHEGPAEVDSTLTWSDISQLRDQTQLPILLKGITHVDDAKLAAEMGCDGIVVSNHGGRQLDGVTPTAEALPAIVATIGDRIEVYVDGGIRRGGDILRALALGATGVLVGRPVLWGLAVGGERGVARVLRLFAEELMVDAALAGISDLQNVPRNLVHRRVST